MRYLKVVVEPDDYEIATAMVVEPDDYEIATASFDRGYGRKARRGELPG